jgi:hypothetical protein
VTFARPRPRLWPSLARAVWLLLAAANVGLLVLMVPINLRTLSLSWAFQTIYPAVAPFLSRSAFAAYTLVCGYAVTLLCLVTGILVTWRKPDDRVAWLAGLLLVMLPMIFNLGGYSDTYGYYPLPWRRLFFLTHEVIVLAGTQALGLFVLLFPNGRPVRRWLVWLHGLYVVFIVVIAAWPGLAGMEPLFAAWVVMWIIVLPVGVGAQAYRYRRLSTPLERQQTKWVVVGLAAWVITLLISGGLTVFTEFTPAFGWALLISVHALWIALALLPITLAFSILRYRLWDIDRLIRRTLLYTLLTAALAGLYLGSVVVLQSAWRTMTGQAQIPLVTVVTTLFIATIARPLRLRVQQAIDRRFNRQRYDAARTVEAFSAALRDNTYADLDQLSTQLTDVVQTTLEPEKVTLWLRS